MLLALAPTRAGADEARLGLEERLRLNEPLDLRRGHVGMGPAVGPTGHQIEVLRSLSDQNTALSYMYHVREMGSDAAALGERLAWLALLSRFGSPDMRNMGTLLASPTNALPTVVGLNIAFPWLRGDERIRDVPRTIAFDGHVHSGRSHDGGDSYEAIFERAVQRGLNAIALTEHNEFDYPRARAVLDAMKAEGRVPGGFVLVPGEEISTLEGHVLAYFISYRVEPGMSAAETIRAIHAQGGLAVAAHPSGRGGVGIETARRLPFDGVELRNGANIFPLDLARELEAAEQGYEGKFVLANSDTHGAEGVGFFFSRLEVDERSPEGLRKALESRRTVAVPESRIYGGYEAGLRSTPVATALWPVLTWLGFKDRVLETVARAVGVDSLQVLTNWEFGVYRLVNLVYLPGEVRRLAGGESALQEPLALRAVAVTMGPFRLAYEPSVLFASSLVDMDYSQFPPMWKLEAKVDF